MCPPLLPLLTIRAALEAAGERCSSVEWGEWIRAAIQPGQHTRSRKRGPQPGGAARPAECWHVDVLCGPRRAGAGRIGAGASFGDPARIVAALRAHGADPKDLAAIVQTHGHADHAGCAASLRDLSDAPVIIHRDDAEMLRLGRARPAHPIGLDSRHRRGARRCRGGGSG